MAIASSIFSTIWIGIALVINNMTSAVMLATASIATGGETSAKATLIQHELSREERATMHSMLAIISGIISAIGMWLFGVIMDIYSVKTAMYGILAIFIAIVFYYKWLGKSFVREK